MQEYEDDIMTRQYPQARKNPLGGCLPAVFSVAILIAVAIIVLPRLENDVRPAAKAEANTQATPTKTAPAPMPTPTVTPNYARMTADAAEALAGELRLTVMAGEATRQAEIDWLELADRRTATAIARLTALPATQTAVHAEAIAVAQRNASDAQQMKIDREIDAGKRVLWEIVIPLFVSVLLGLLAFAGLASFGKAVLDDVKNPQPVIAEEYDTDEETAPAPSFPYPATIEVSSPSRSSIIRSKADETIMKILPVFARYATGLAEADENANPLTDGEWAGEDKRGVTKPDWYKFRNWLIENRFARWKNERAHTLGAELTDERGWPLMKRIAEGDPPSPTELGIK